jgi:hypothetical protein
MPVWRRWLRLLDALEAGENLHAICPELALYDPERAASSAIAMRGGGYRRLLMLGQ